MTPPLQAMSEEECGLWLSAPLGQVQSVGALSKCCPAWKGSGCQQTPLNDFRLLDQVFHNAWHIVTQCRDTPIHEFE